MNTSRLTQREVVRSVLQGERPPWVPWSFKFTVEADPQLKFGAIVDQHRATRDALVGKDDAGVALRFPRACPEIRMILISGYAPRSVLTS